MLTSYSASELADILPGDHIINDPNLVISHLFIDSRRSHHSSVSLFIALVGDFRNGHQYIEEMYDSGVRNFLVSQEVIDLPNANIYRCDDTIAALQFLAIHQRNTNQMEVVGVTGSNGKTIVKEWLFQLLHDRYKVVRSPKSYNSQIGVPLSVWGMNSSYNLAIFEAGISHSGEMEKLEKIIQPTIGIFTNIGLAHQENFSNMEEKVAEKIKLFKDSETVIYNCDSKIISSIIDAQIPRSKQLRWGKCTDADFIIKNVNKLGASTIIEGIYNHKNVSIKIPFYDNASIENAIQCWAYMLLHHIPNKEIENRFSYLEPIAMRLEQKEGIDDSIILNDSYNADINALEIALDYMSRLNRTKKTVILSDILQTGEDAKTLYSKVNKSLVNRKIHQFIGIGKNLFEHQDLFELRSKHFYQTTQQFLDDFYAYDFYQHGILVKGARKFAFERITAKLALKSHQTQLKIHLDAIKHNLNFYRGKIAPNVKAMGMVKAYGYGAGGPEVARVLANNGISYLGVAYADEGLAIRKAGIFCPIMVMNPAEEAFSTMINYELEPEIYSIDVFQNFNKTLQTEGVFNSSYKIHLKIDTGMNRLGIRPEEVDTFLKILKRERHITVASVFSHLAGSMNPKFDDFTNSQIELFKKIAAKIETALGYPVIKHIANTGGIERFPSAQLDMVRVGVGLYGVASDPKNQIQLRNVSSLHSIVVQVKKVKKGESVGYDRTYFAENDMQIAIIPIGYADGLDRRLSNGVGKVFICGEKRPIIGSICMDLIMVDVTGLHPIINERVEIFGPHIPVYEIAKQAGTISYEILSGIPPRVKRIYIKEDS